MIQGRTGLLPRLGFKYPYVAVLLAGIVFVTALSAGCLSDGGRIESPPGGTPESGPVITRIGSILENPSFYENRTVIVSGKITLECGSGCWFTLDDGTGTIYVDLKAHNFAIPQKGGSQAVVTGTVISGAAGPSIDGERVEVDGKVYP